MSKVFVVVTVVEGAARPPIRVRVFAHSREGFEQARAHMEAERQSGARDVSLWDERVS